MSMSRPIRSQDRYHPYGRNPYGRTEDLKTVYYNSRGERVQPPRRELTESEKKSAVIAEGCDAVGPFQHRMVTVREDGEFLPSGQVSEQPPEQPQPYSEKEPERPWKDDAPRCPLHPQYGMCEKEIDTKRGPSRFHHCPHEECPVSCFGDEQDVSWYLYVVDRSLHFKYRDPHCPLICFCNELLLLRVSGSEKNKDRLYFTCRRREEDGGCKTFQWGDVAPRKKLDTHWLNYLNN